MGSGADELARRAAASLDRVTQAEDAETLYAVQFTADPAVRGRPTVERILDAITAEIRHVDADCPRLVRDEEVERPPSRFGGLRYEVMAVPGKEWIGEVVWRAVHPVVAGAPITTRALIEERPSYTRISVRVTADNGRASVRGDVGAGQAQPAFLRTLRAELTPTWLGGPLRAHPISEGDIVDLVKSTLAEPSRDVPIAVLAPLEEGGYVVDPEELAWDLLGRARLHVIQDHGQTFELSDAVGDRRMSCYFGAVRCYMPGWTRHDDPRDHPLLIGERLADPVLRATWLGEIGRWRAERTELPPSIEERRRASAPPEKATTTGDSPHGTSPASSRAAPPESATRPASSPPDAAGRAAGITEPPDEAPREDRSPAEASQSGSIDPRGAPPNPAPPAVDPTPLIQELIREVQGLAQRVGDLADEVERLRTISSVRSSSTNAIERRLVRLEDILEQAFPDGSGAYRTAAVTADSVADNDVDDGRTTLVDVVQDCAESCSDALVILDSAFRSARESPYEDPERVRAILEAMAHVARRRRDGVLGTSLREAFNDLGIDYRAAIAKTTPERLREQYRFFLASGDLVEAEEHIALGNTYDPRRCLRVYFSSRVPNEPRFVIGHVGRHFQVITTT